MFDDSAEQLDEWRQRIARYLEGHRLRLHPRKTAIVCTSEPAQFLGFVLLGDGGRRLPEDNVRRFRNRLRGMRDRYRNGTMEKEDVIRRVRSWVAHAEHANTWRLRQAIFRASRFSDARKPSTGERNGNPAHDRPWPSPERVLRGGSWNNKPSNLRAANRNRNTTGNRNNNNGFRVARPLECRSRWPNGAVGRVTSVQGWSC